MAGEERVPEEDLRGEPRFIVTIKPAYIHYELYGWWRVHAEVDNVIASIRDVRKTTPLSALVADLRGCEFSGLARQYVWSRLEDGRLVRSLALINRSSMLVVSVNMHAQSAEVRKKWKMAMRSFDTLAEGEQWLSTLKP